LFSDIEAGDGTTSVCVIAGALLNACQALLEKGIHPTQISESFMDALVKASLPDPSRFGFSD
jgi:T-complex protein 1 subunit delta